MNYQDNGYYNDYLVVIYHKIFLGFEYAARVLRTYRRHTYHSDNKVIF